MKRMLITCVLALVAGAAMLFAQDGHQLTNLWKEYEKAAKADRPQKEAEALAKIKAEAARQHLEADFYDAATLYVQAVQRRDWKQRDALREALAQEVRDFNEPIVTFLWMAHWNSASMADLQAYVKELTGNHPALHRDVDGLLNGCLKPFIKTDKEYALWYLLGRRYGKDPELTQALEQEVAGKYPNQAAWEYFQIKRKTYKENEEKQAWEALAAQYADQAFGVYPSAELLRLRFAQLNENNADGPAYKALYTDAEALEKRRSACKGEDKTLVQGCRYPQDLMETLSAQSLGVRFEENKADIVFRNLTNATVTLREGEKVLQTWKLQNEKASFYVQDTVKIGLPVLPDGDYTLEAVNGKVSAESTYTQYTLSLAALQDSRGWCVYVADYKTGVPLRSVTLQLKKNGKEVALSTLKLDGFTPLPKALTQHIEGTTANWELVALSGNRKSRGLLERNSSYSPRTYADQVRCNIYKDRGAYNPGDTLQFKAIVYQGDPSKGLEVIKGRKVEMVLRDSQDNPLQKLQLTTNDWGAVSGRFVLPTNLRGGRFELEAVGLGYDWFPVDEFVAPTFDLEFDPVDRLYLTGDEVPVSGRLTSYSGHNLSGARIRVKVTRYNTVVYDEESPVAEDNTFKAVFPTSESGYYNAEVTVTEATGETRSFSTGWYIGKYVRVTADVWEEADAETEGHLITAPTLKVTLQALDGEGNKVPLQVGYELLDLDKKLLASGQTPSGEILTLTLPGDGVYMLKAKALERETSFRIVCLQPGSRKLCKGVNRVFVSGPADVPAGSTVTARVGSGDGDVYGVATLYGESRKVLVHKTFHVANGSVDNLSFTYKDSYPDAVRLQVFYFLNGRTVQYDREYRRAKDKYALPLAFTRFQDKAYPGTQVSFTVKTAAGTEALVAAWDKSLDAIEENNWALVHNRDFSVESVYVSSVCGRVGGSSYYDGPYYRTTALAKSVGTMNTMDAAVEEAIPFQLIEQKPAFGAGYESVTVREKFALVLTFQPHLKPAADGTLNFSFGTSDKLSTYYVRVYAHDKKMHNALVQDELVVSLPVKVSILEPRYLYVGDTYQAAVTVSSLADEPVSGELSLQVGDHIEGVSVTVPAGKTVTRYFTCHSERSEESLTLTAIFRAAEFSDAVRVHVPVYEASQELTEAHSTVLRSGMSYEALLSDLRSRFVNVPASEASLRDITVLDMVRDAIPSHMDPKGKDVLSLSEAWYVRQVASSVIPSEVEESLLDRILACRNADGGFAWFEGMRSNPFITSVLLERFAKLRDRGFEVPDLTATVKYLDQNRFALGSARYVYVRSFYADVPFTEKAVSQTEKKQFKAFTKEVKAHLVPSKKDGRGLQGRILAKAQRLLTLRNLLERDGGLALAKAWGISLGAKSKLQKSIKADMTSLLEYAVEHRDGGWYYPNAVMPWRGLQESEAYAHALLCNLLNDSAIADGIRLWLMLQKETQKWEAEPAFIDAITAILDGSPEVLGTRVLALSATYRAPLSQIKASGNGFTVERRFYRDGVEIVPGDSVKVGDRITVKYVIWNAENRSFVRLTAGREASLAPVKQLSGLVGWTGYRWVKASATEYYFETYPEEKTTVTEDFFVERAGSFVAPVTVIESLYAPHYRANSAFRPPLRIENR